MRRMVGTKRVFAFLLAAFMAVGVCACGKSESTEASVSYESSAETSSEQSVDEKTSVLESDSNYQIFKGVLTANGYTDSKEYVKYDKYIYYFDQETWDNFTFTKYENEDEANAGSISNPNYSYAFNILGEKNFSSGKPCKIVVFTEDDLGGYEITFDNYVVLLKCSDTDKLFNMCQKLVLDLCQTEIVRESDLTEGATADASKPAAEERKVIYEVEPEDTTKFYRLSSGTNVNTFNDSVFYIPAVPGLVAFNCYLEPAPLVGESNENCPNRVFFMNQYGDEIMYADYNRESQGSTIEGIPYDYVRIGCEDIDMSSVIRTNVNFGELNAEVLVRDYSCKENKDLKKEVIFVFPCCKQIWNQNYRVESMSLTYRCATVREAFEFMDSYLANDIEFEHQFNNTELVMHKLSGYTTEWIESFGRKPEAVPHVQTPTVDWKEFVDSIEPAADNN